MSFRLADLKKSVRKGKEGYQVTPARLEGRPAAFRIEFLLQQFEAHLGRPRRTLDPEILLDFVGDARLGRALLATLSQWYRMRPRTFAEALEDGGARLLARGITGPVDLRAWLYGAVNRDGSGFLAPEEAALFWQGQACALGAGRELLPKLMSLDRPEEAILVRTGPPPSAADVIAAYNARAHTTLLRSATDLALRCSAPRALLERAARAWAGSVDVAWRVERDTLHLFGRADALGCWTRHGRRVERATLELLALSDMGGRALSGRIHVGERSCRFVWSEEVLATLGAGRGGPLREEMPDQVAGLATSLRRERAADAAWSVRRPLHLLAVEGGVCLPHLELRRGDQSLHLRLAAEDPAGDEPRMLAPFRDKTPVVLVAWPGDAGDTATLQLVGEPAEACAPHQLLGALARRLDRLAEAAATATERRRLKPAA
jgi:hypothetical protein